MFGRAVRTPCLQWQLYFFMINVRNNRHSALQTSAPFRVSEDLYREPFDMSEYPYFHFHDSTSCPTANFAGEETAVQVAASVRNYKSFRRGGPRSNNWSAYASFTPGTTQCLSAIIKVGLERFTNFTYPNYSCKLYLNISISTHAFFFSLLVFRIPSTLLKIY